MKPAIGRRSNFVLALLAVALLCSLPARALADSPVPLAPDRAHATSIPVDGTPQAHTYPGAGGTDWIAFPATAGKVYGMLLTKGATSWTVPHTTVYLADGTADVWSDRIYPEYPDWGARALYQCRADGQLYIKLDCSSYEGVSTYTVSVTAYDRPVPGAADIYEPDDYAAVAQPIATDGVPQIHACEYLGADYIAFQVRAGHDYKWAVNWVGGTGYGMPHVIDENGNQLSAANALAPASGNLYASHDATWYLYMGTMYSETPYAASVQELPASHIQGAVTDDPSGAPCAGARVSLYAAYPDGMLTTVASPPVAMATTLTAADGTYDFDVAPGNYGVGFDDPAGQLFGEFYNNVQVLGYVEYVSLVTVGESATVSAVSGHLHEPATLAGSTTRQSDGSALAGAHFTLYQNRPTINGSALAAVGGATTGPDGRYSVAGLDPRYQYVVAFEATAGLLPLTNPSVSLLAGDVTTVDTSYTAPAHVVGGVTDGATGDGVGGITVTLTNASYQDIASTTTSGDGHYAFDAVSAGTWRLRFDDPRGSYKSVWYPAGWGGSPIQTSWAQTTTADQIMYADTWGPTTTALVPTGWQRGSVDVTLTAADNGPAGVAELHWGLDDWWNTGGMHITYAAEQVVHVTGGGTHTVQFYSVDKAGNREWDTETTVRIDDQAPATTCDVQPEYVGTATVSFSAGDAQSGVGATYYSIDDGPTMQLASADTLKEARAGAHTLAYWSVEKAGNAELPHEAAFRVRYMPVTTIGPLPASWVNHPVAVSLSATEPGALQPVTTYWMLEGGAPNVYGGPVMLASEGVSTIAYYSADADGQVEATKTATVRIDLTSPSTREDHVPTYVSDATIHLTATDAVSGVWSTQWDVDGAPGVGPTTVCSVIGTHTLRYRSVDWAGNAEATHTITFTVARASHPTLVRLTAPASVKVKKAYVLSGVVRPTDAPGKVKLTIARLVGRQWKTAKTATLVLNRSAFAYRYAPRTKGSWKMTASYLGATLARDSYVPSSATRSFKVK